MRTRVTCVASLAMVAATGSWVVPVIAGQSYVFVDLGTLTDRSSHGLGMNEVGDVCGMSNITGTPGSPGQPAIPFINHGFRWSNGTMIDIGAIPSGGCPSLGCESRAEDINDAGLITGWSATPYQVAFVWSENSTPILNAGFNPLPSLFAGNTNNQPKTINNAMQVVGECHGPGGLPRRVAIWNHNGTNWTVMDPGTLRPDNTGYGGAYDINELGQVVGDATNIVNDLDAFLWLPQPAYGLPAGMNDLTPGTANSHGNAVNDLGQVVGVFGVATAWIWLPEPAYGFPAGMSYLPLYNGAFNVIPTDINNQGEIVGTAFVVQGQSVLYKGVLFREGHWVLLDDLLPPGTPWIIRNYALGGAINDAGEMAGDALSPTIMDINGFQAIHGYKLVPAAPGDVDLDGDVDVDDLLAVIAAWGPCPDPPVLCAADQDGDGEVNVNDLLIVIDNWG